MDSTTKLKILSRYLHPGKYLNTNSPCYICDEGVVCVAHHIIPRQYGGDKTSMLVWICPNCHKNLHAVESAIGSKDFKDPFNKEKLLDIFGYIDNHKKAIELLSVLLIARDVISNDPKKSKTVSFRSDYVTSNKIDKLKLVYTKKTTGDILKYAVDLLYKKHF